MSLKEFLQEINVKIGVELLVNWAGLNEVILAQRFLSGLNKYFYQTYESIGTTTFNGEELKYFSDFHKFWEAHHREIINAKIDRAQARLAAQSLNNAITYCGNQL